MREIGIENGCSSLLDYGCGIGAKLNSLIKDICPTIYGIDNAYNIRRARNLWKFGKWCVDDLEHPKSMFGLKFDIIISIDVIKHLVNPEALLSVMSKHSHTKTIFVISTPDRNVLDPKNQLGLPSNPTHIREWNKEEFISFISSNGLEILNHKYLPSVKNNPSELSCQIVLAKRRLADRNL